MGAENVNPRTGSRKSKADDWGGTRLHVSSVSWARQGTWTGEDRSPGVPFTMCTAWPQCGLADKPWEAKSLGKEHSTVQMRRKARMEASPLRTMSWGGNSRGQCLRLRAFRVLRFPARQRSQHCAQSSGMKMERWQLLSSHLKKWAS